MENGKKEINFTEFLVIFVKWKYLLIPITLLSMVIGYLAVYFLIDEEFESKSLILPSQEDSFSNLAGLSGLMKNMKKFPLDITGGVTNIETSTFNTIISSRTILEDVIKKFDLPKVYDIDTMAKGWKESLVKSLRENIKAEENEDFAYEIKVTSNTPRLSADINNYLIEQLNKKIIELKNKKSRENRVFLEKRLSEVKMNLRVSEDSLRKYQELSGIYDAKEQVKELVGAYSSLETELITRQIEESVLKNLLDKNSPQLNSARIEVDEFKKRLDELKNQGEPNGLIQPLSKLPKKTLNFLRYYREVEINTAILEFVIPLYEQSKFDEQKDMPILQIVDYAVPPAKKSYPPRTLFTVIIGLGIFLLSYLYILIKENANINSSDMQFIKTNLFKWKTPVN